MKIIFYSSIIFCVLTSFTSFSQVCNTLIAAYNFNGNAQDITGHGYDLTVNGATLTVDRFGNGLSAYHVSGLTSLGIITTDFPQLHQNFTYSIWFKADAFTGGYGPIWMYGNNPDTCSSSIQVTLRPDMMGSVKLLDVSAGCLDNNVMHDIGGHNPGWNFITVVNDGVHLKTFLNGGVLDIVNSAFLISSQSIFNIGIHSEYLNGAAGVVDDLFIYNCALSDSEVFYLSSEMLNSENVQINIIYSENIFTLNTSKEWINSSIIIYDLNGKIISKSNLTNEKMEYSTAIFEEGYYVISIMGTKKIYNSKLIVLH